MNFTHLSYFLMIAEEESISNAARKLFMSQQSLSAHLNKIEKEVGTPLFKRNAKMTLTPAGETFYKGCQRILSDYNSLLLDIHMITTERHNKVSIGIPTYGRPPYLPEVINALKEDYPEYKYNIVKRQHMDVAQHMDGVDLYLSPLPLHPELENHIILENDPYCVTFRKSLAESVYGEEWSHIEEDLLLNGNLSVLSNMPYAILLDRYGQIALDLRQIFVENNFHPQIEMTSETMEFLEIACLNGTACMIAPDSYTTIALFDNPNADCSDLLSFPIKTQIETKLAISHRKNIHLHPAEEAFINECTEYFEKHHIY